MENDAWELRTATREDVETTFTLRDWKINHHTHTHIYKKPDG